ncbi:MAG: double-strand break repair protein AddB [Rhodospirillales bacterium]|jgi:ATP-dependent helicase/nuclease subunit B|nr:double-strand break repair protein AddB [Rhodospirillales bacterium]
MSAVTIDTGHIYTIPAGLPFVDALAAGLWAQAGGEPAALARATVLLPTRRSCRSLREAFLRLRRGRPTLLPRLLALGDMDEDELALAGWQSGETEGPGGGLETPPALSGMRRQLLLTRLVLALGTTGTTPDHAARLAFELARLLDQVETERLSFDALADLVPDDFADHWRITLDFLRIVTERWPAILAAEDGVDAARRRNLLLAAQAEAWRRQAPADPVVVAGSTGSIPATADLLAVVAGLPRGAVVLPGLDRRADAETRQAYPPSHPQFAMARLLEHLCVEPEAVEDWPAPGVAATTPARAELVHRALRPAAALEAPDAKAPDADALTGVSRIESASEQEEAGAIALVLRQALEDEGRTAALVTPDRSLARRVAAELRRWDVEIDDSAGQPLDRTPPGAFLRLTARMVSEGFAPVPLLAALKHPLAGGGEPVPSFRAAIRRLEIDVLRGPRPAAGLAGLRAAVAQDDPDLAHLVDTLDTATRPFQRLVDRGAAPLPDLLRAHVAMAEGLAAGDGEDGAARLWAGENGEAAAAFVAELAQAGEVLDRVATLSYPALFDTLMAGRVVRPRWGRHPRLNIWGLLEARLQHADVLVLGGLNEGTWPPEAVASPWMSRPMLSRFGLPQPERRIGQTAHDFAQAFSAPRVVLSRASRVGGTPTVPSRWLSRIENLVQKTPLEAAFRPDPRWRAWWSGLDGVAEPRPVAPPAPCPPVAARPRRLSVTAVETWIRDPYAIYARRVLGLKPLDPLDAEPGAAERGTIIHEILERFVAAYPTDLPDDALEKLVAIGDEVFNHSLARPGLRAFWWPRFRRIARWFVEFERRQRAAGLAVAATEVDGMIEIAGPAGPFALTARADRIDRRPGGGLRVVDYKTGQAPTWPMVKSGLVPQLSLEAAIAETGGFEGLEAGVVEELAYLRLSGGRQPGEEKAFANDVATVTAEALDGLNRRVTAYDDPRTPYLSRPRPMFIGRFGDYDHLARVQEWLSGQGDGE